MENNPSSTSLSQGRILVTRPRHQSDNLCRLIEARGGQAIRLPTIEIAPPDDLHKASVLIDQLDQYHIAIFISANAVQYAHRLINTHSQWPPHLRVAAIGQSTAKQLKQLDLPVDIAPRKHFNSEALLALDEMNTVQDKNIIIFRGQQGRELLGDTLKTRCANVVYANVYQRKMPHYTAQEITAVLDDQTIDIIIATSNEILHNLIKLSQSAQHNNLLDSHLVVISQRTASLAHELHFKYPATIAKQANDEGLVAAIEECYANTHQQPG